MEPMVDMNPVLLKPTGNAASQVIIMGKPVGNMSAREYHRGYSLKAFDAVKEALVRLDKEYDTIVIEGAGKVRQGIVSVKAYRKSVDLKELEAGDIVYVTKLDQKGTVLSVKGKELEVQLGSMKINVKAKECKFVDKAPKEKKTSAGNGKKSGNRGNSFMGKTQQAHRDIDIRGMMVDEAEVALDRFIDDSVMAGLSQVLIIHGKGTGALRKGVHSYLKRHRNVANFNFADMSEGGTGATLVELQ